MGGRLTLQINRLRFLKPENQLLIMKTLNLHRTQFRAPTPLRSSLVLLTSAILTGHLAAAGLTARWSFDEMNSPFADSGPNAIPMTLDTETTPLISGTGIAGNAAELNWQDPPGVATRLAANDTALQTNSFGFSFWINPISLNPSDVLIGKEMAFDDTVENWRRQAWQVQVLGDGRLEFIVRGDNRVAGDFFGAVQSTYTFTLATDSPEWIHVSGGYDSITGALSFYVNGIANYANGTPGATNSDGAPLVFGTQRNGSDFVNFAAGAQIDEAQIYDAPLTADEVAYLKANPEKTIIDRPVPNLAAHWKLDEASSPYASSAAVTAVLVLDTETTPALSENPALIGNAAVLNFGTPSIATRLFTDAAPIQTDSFGFSFWIRPDSLSEDNVLIMKESPANINGDPDYALCSWKLTVLHDDDINGFSPLQLVVRGSDRTNPEPFFGEITSSAQLALNTNSSTWVHIAGGYDAVTGAIALYVNDGDSLNSSDSKIVTAGASNSDGTPLSIGSAKNGSDFIGFAAGVAIDDVQMYDGFLTFSQSNTLFSTPGVTLVPPADFKILAYSYDSVTGDMSVTFESIDGASYNLDASTTLAAWTLVKTVTGTGTSTTATLSKAELDAVLGGGARPKAFVRVGRP